MRLYSLPMLERLSFIAAALMVASTGAAQQTGDVSGMVYDSVARAPLRGAVVQMVPPAGTPLYSATTDARGRYTIAGAPAGSYTIDFAHQVLDSLAIEPPSRNVEVRAAEVVRVDLAVPAPETIVTQACRTAPTDSVGLLFGILKDSRSGMGLDSGQVVARWSELVIVVGGMSNRERFAAARTVRDGWFAMCRVPSNAEVLVQALRSADSTGISLVKVPEQGLVRFDIAIGGVASVRGRVSSQGRPVENARVRAANSERSAYTDSAGEYRLAGVPAGTQTLEVRALGYAPEAIATTLAPESDTPIDVQLTSVKRVMDTIRVAAQRIYSIDAMGFERRRKSRSGLFFDADVVRRRSPYSVLQLLYEVPSMRVEQQGLERTFMMRGGNAATGLPCPPAFFLNGARMPDEMLSELDLLVRPNELQGMEVYQGLTVPPEFFANGACGAVIVWTRRAPPKR